MSDSYRQPSGRSDREILSHIRRLAEGGQPPTATEFRQDPDAPSAALVAHRFGSWNNGVKMAGLEPRPRGAGQTHSDEELLDHIRRLADGGSPTAHEFKSDERAPSLWMVEDRFGSWTEAVETAGFEPAIKGRGRAYSDEEILNHIRRLAEGDQPPMVEELTSDEDAPSLGTVRNQFGSWSEAVETAGFEPIPRGRNGISRADLINYLLVWRRKFEGWPSAADLREWPGPSPDTYRRVFGGLSEAIKAAKEADADD